MKRLCLTLATLALSTADAAAQTPAARPAAADRPAPTLVLFLTVDQLRPDYFTRFGPQLTGGLRRLYDGGAVFTDAHQDHAITETAPGHASTLSGRHPQHTGIVRNDAGVADPQARLVGTGGAGASPYRFRGGTLTDWMRSRDARTRALSVSRKDRGAILPLGRAKQHVFWYGPDGRFTTSTYYADTLPDWVKRFNASGRIERFVETPWTPLLAEDAYPERDSIPRENSWKDFTFPHRATGATPQAAAWQLTELPWMDQLTLDLAFEGLVALNLGRGPQTDVLAVSLSTTDAVGHRYGPDSREMHDQILRVDRMLGVFLDSLYRVRDSARVVIALTSDHGVAPYPELHFEGSDEKRGRVDLRPILADHRRRAVARGVDSTALRFMHGMSVITQDRAAYARAGVNPDVALAALLADVRRVPGVLRTDVRAGLAAKARAGDRVAEQWVHSLPSDLDAAAVVTFRPYFYASTTTNATHGTPHAYDSHVPVIFYGPPFRPGKYAGFVRTVDIAPTLARVLGVPPTEPLDGRVLTQALKP